MPNREGGYGGYQSSQPQQNRMPRKVNAPGSGKVRRGVDPAGLGAQRPPQRPTRPAQQPPEPPRRRRTAERPAAQPQPVHRAAPRPQQRSSYHLLLAGVITLLLPSNKAVENVPVGTEQTAQAGRLVAPVPYADSDGSGNGGPSIDWGTIGPVQQAETYTYTAAPQAPDMVPEFGRVSTDWFSDAAFLGDSLTAGIAYYDINVGGALVLGYEGTSPNQIVNRTALKNTNEDDAEQVPLDILAEQQPAKLYLLIGTNALAGLGNDEGFLAYYGKLLDELQSTLPNSMIFVQSILNVRPEALDQAPGLTPERVGSMNDKIKEMCKERGFYYLNLTEAFTGEDGYLTADYAQNDGIHLHGKGLCHQAVQIHVAGAQFHAVGFQNGGNGAAGDAGATVVDVPQLHTRAKPLHPRQGVCAALGEPVAVKLKVDEGRIGFL